MAVDSDGGVPDGSPTRWRETLRATIEAIDPTGPQPVLVLLSTTSGSAEVTALLDELRPGITTVRLDEAPTATGPTGRADIQVRMLGPVEVRGVEGPLERHPKLTELIVYLAMHPGGALTRSICAAMWPERDVPQQTVQNRLSEARRALGFASDTLSRLRRRGDRHLIVELDTDWATFTALSSGHDSPASWRAALELVRGRPFDDLQQGEWVLIEGFAAEVESAIVDCAIALGEHCLGEGDGDGAAWAAQRGLRASPFDERLHRLYMRAAAAVGNLAGVAETLQRLAAILEVEGDPLAGVHPATAALYAALTSGGARA